MDRLLDRMLRRLIIAGSLDVIWPDGRATHYAGLPGPSAGLRLRDDATVRRIVLDPDLAFGEAYMDGGIEPIGCDIYAVLDLMMRNTPTARYNAWSMAVDRLRAVTRRLRQTNKLPRARRNVAHHYNLNERLFRLFLDDDMQYSCAYFETGRETLDQAQYEKKHHIAAKLNFDRQGLSVLDIGCGWGGMALTLAREYGAHVTGITLSEEQLSVARARAEASGLSGQVRFELCDYRHARGQFDRIVSVGMLEHVGVPNYRGYFETVRDRLAADGVALIHTFGRADGPSHTSAWIEKYIFPGGYSPALSELATAVEASGLLLTDLETLRLHYAHTIAAWRQRFASQRARIRDLYDERFCRMFEFYLAGAQLSFLWQGHVNFQMQLTRAVDALPITRDYMVSSEAASVAARGPVGVVG